MPIANNEGGGQELTMTSMVRLCPVILIVILIVGHYRWAMPPPINLKTVLPRFDEPHETLYRALEVINSPILKP